MYAIDFLRYRVVCAIFSAMLFLGFAGLCVYRLQTRGYVFNYSVDFTGGTQVLLKFEKPMTDAELRPILEQQGWKNPILRDFSPLEILVRVKEFSTDAKGFAVQMKAALEATLTDNHVDVLSVDSVSGAIGEILRANSIWAVLFALLLMLIYIWFRFWSLSFGLGAVLALFHDAVVILFAFLLLDKEISMNVISAILAVLGYSVNDTIVIFTKIRQNIKTLSNRMPIEEIVNISLNQTLRRTLLTSIATALVVLSLLLLGGESLRDLSIALLVGIVFGTYSSIYIASPIMLLFYKEPKAQLNKAGKIA